MESKVNYAVVGFFVIVLGVSMVAWVIWLTSFRQEKTYNTYLVYVREDVTGLSIQTPIRYNGVPVGYVKNIELDAKNPQLVKITLRIEEGTPVLTSTVASLQLQGITGTLYMGLMTTSLDAPPLKAKAGEKYPVIPSQPSLFVQLSQAVASLTKNIEVVGERVSQLLNDKNQQAIKETLENFSVFTKTLSNHSKQLGESMVNLDATLKNAASASKDLPQSIKQFNDSLSALKTTSQNINNQVIPPAQVLFNQLKTVATTLQQFTTELQRNPSMLVRGKQAPEKGPGE